MQRNRGQNVIEYILLVVAVISIFVVFLHPDGPFKKRVERTLYDSTVKHIKGVSSEIQFTGKSK